MISAKYRRPNATETATRSAEYKGGYNAGYAAGRTAATREIEGTAPAGPKPKYSFDTLSVGQSKTVPETDTRKVYNAARQWARRNAPSRRFTMRAAGRVTVVSRTA